MTAWETKTPFDIAESGIFPMSVRELLAFEPREESDRILARLLDLRLGYSEAPGTLELRSMIAATYRDTTSRGDPRHDGRHRGELPPLQRAPRAGRPRRRRLSGLSTALQRPARHRLRRGALEALARDGLPLRPGRARTARDAAHAFDRDQHAAQPDRLDALRRGPAPDRPARLLPSERGSFPTRRTAGSRSRAASRWRRRCATSAAGTSASEHSRNRSGCRDCGSAGSRGRPTSWRSAGPRATTSRSPPAS